MIFKQYIPSYMHYKLFISIQPYMLGWDFLRLQQFWFRFSSHTSLFGFKLTRRWQWHSTTKCYALLHWGDPSYLPLYLSECFPPHIVPCCPTCVCCGMSCVVVRPRNAMHIGVVRERLVAARRISRSCVLAAAQGDIQRRGIEGVFGSSWKGGWAWNWGVKSSTRDEERWRVLWTRKKGRGGTEEKEW